MDKNEDIKVGSLLLFDHNNVCNLWIVLKVISEDLFHLYCLRRTGNNPGGQTYTDHDPFRALDPDNGFDMPYYKLILR